MRFSVFFGFIVFFAFFVPAVFSDGVSLAAHAIERGDSNSFAEPVSPVVVSNSVSAIGSEARDISVDSNDLETDSQGPPASPYSTVTQRIGRSITITQNTVGGSEPLANNNAATVSATAQAGVVDGNEPTGTPRAGEAGAAVPVSKPGSQQASAPMPIPGYSPPKETPIEGVAEQPQVQGMTVCNGSVCNAVDKITISSGDVKIETSKFTVSSREENGLNDLKVDANAGGERISVQKNAATGPELVSNGVIASTIEPVSISGGSVSIGGSVIGVSPSVALKKAEEAIGAQGGKVSIVIEGKPIYVIDGKKQAKLFWLIPVDFDTKTKVDSSSAEVLSVEKPWWSVFAS
ncbi:Uncharacterised protein [uncultured archaeon]|nr:Uncharacterised protein [uncultured archaeon]